MKKILMLIMLLIIVFSLAGCGCNRTEEGGVIEFLDNVVSAFGSAQLTKDADLIGTRESEDKYTGTYSAECEDITGRDVIFGGGSIEEYKLLLHGNVMANSGKANIRIRLNDSVVMLDIDESGIFETTLRLKSGGNYIMVDYEDFSGDVELVCEYIENDC